MFKPLDFRPDKRGLAKVMGDLEADVMERVWALEPCTVRDIYEDLRLQRRIAYTTVMTIMTRLSEKRLLIKDTQGSAFTYRASITREDLEKAIAAQVINGLVDGFGAGVYAHLIDAASKADPQALAELERLIQERRREK